MTCEGEFLKASRLGAPFGAPTTDPRFAQVRQFLFYRHVGDEVDTAKAAVGDDAVFAVEAGISLAVKCKYPGIQHLASLVALRKPLLQRFVVDLACAPDGGALDPPSAVIFRDRIDQLGVESPLDLSLLAEGDFAGIPSIRVRRVLPLLQKMGEMSASRSDAAYSSFMAACPVTLEVVKSLWAEESYTGTFDNGRPLEGPSPVDMWSGDPNPVTLVL